MHRTTVYLPDELKAALERASRAEGRSEADLIREGVRRVAVDRHRSPRLPLFRSGGDPTMAERAEELLEGFGQR